ncbi:ABC transporter ATP-binding protein [Tabrizicola sp. M-4]|uniref:ABC transporter ATP-binding protein n=1 Tax=Tabrizicola sp. M-4 TaxID=3055847 RepID=UPI003DA8C512
MLELSDICVRYGAIQAVQGVSLHVAKGEIVSLLGANGAGKTSLVSAVAGIVALAGGSVRFDGCDLSRRPAETVVTSGLTLCPEGRRVFAELTVRENLVLGAATRRDRAGVESDIERFFTMFPILRERASTEAKTLSGGEQQMLAIARALMCKPRLLMLDEPSLGLAPKIVERIFELLVGLKAQGMTILLVEQNASDALAISDRAYVMANGRVVHEGAASGMIGAQDLADAYLGGH